MGQHEDEPLVVFVLSKRHTGKKKQLPPTLSHQLFHSPEAITVTSFLRSQFGYLWYLGVMKVFQKYNIQIPLSKGKLPLNVENEAWLSVGHQEESWPSANLVCNSQAQHTANESLWLSDSFYSGSKSTWNVIFHSWKSRRIDTFQGRSSHQ